MIGDPEVIFWILVALLCLIAVAFMGLGATIIAIIELSLKEGTHGTNEPKESENNFER